MECIVPTYTEPRSTPLPVTTVIPDKEDAPRALALALEQKRHRGATWYMDGLLLDGRAGGAAVRVEGGREKERTVIPLGEGQVYDGEVEVWFERR
jgi:hypothetical protein